MQILDTPTFERPVKKLHKQQKLTLDEAVRTICGNPAASESKVGDFADVQVYKFRIGELLCILVYRLLDGHRVALLMVGPRENFYRDLKPTGH
jgi:mRNA-degrading endonuclease RelE of RelBE toxin-antitoxin system